MYGPRARRCAHDDVNWPFLDQYKTCPLCGRETFVALDEEPLEPKAAVEYVEAEVRRRKLYVDFERYYEEREVERLRAELESVPN